MEEKNKSNKNNGKKEQEICEIVLQILEGS